MKPIKLFSFGKLTALFSLLLILSGSALADTYQVLLKDDVGGQIIYRGTFDFTVGSGTTATINIPIGSGNPDPDQFQVTLGIDETPIEEWDGTGDKESYYSNTSRVQTISGSGARISFNANGTWLIDNGANSGTYFVHNFATIPIASTFYLMLAGLSGALLLRRKNRRR